MVYSPNPCEVIPCSSITALPPLSRSAPISLTNGTPEVSGSVVAESDSVASLELVLSTTHARLDLFVVPSGEGNGGPVGQ